MEQQHLKQTKSKQNLLIQQNERITIHFYVWHQIASALDDKINNTTNNNNNIKYIIIKKKKTFCILIIFNSLICLLGLLTKIILNEHNIVL